MLTHCLFQQKMISKEKKEEEMRLDLMMEAERVADLKRMSEREKIRHEGVFLIHLYIITRTSSPF